MDTETLALRIDAPMQSWGLRSRFTERMTATEPTKSGIVGLLASASGVARDDDERVQWLANLPMGVRVDREGLVERDYHVTEDVPVTDGSDRKTVVSERYYLADALFLVVIEADRATVRELEEAVTRPHRPLFFGRKAFVPAGPLVEVSPERRRRWGTGVEARSVAERLASHPWLEDRPEQRREARASNQASPLRTLVDARADEPGAEIRRDHPESFVSGRRRFRPRPVMAGHVALTDEMITGEAPCT